LRLPSFRDERGPRSVAAVAPDADQHPQSPTGPAAWRRAIASDVCNGTLPCEDSAARGVGEFIIHRRKFRTRELGKYRSAGEPSFTNVTRRCKQVEHIAIVTPTMCRRNRRSSVHHFRELQIDENRGGTGTLRGGPFETSCKAQPLCGDASRVLRRADPRGMRFTAFSSRSFVREFFLRWASRQQFFIGQSCPRENGQRATPYRLSLLDNLARRRRSRGAV